MKRMKLTDLTEEQEQLVFNLGMLRIVEIIFEGMPPVDRLRKNTAYVTEKTGLSDDQIWESYEFASQAAFDVGRPEVRPTVGFKSKP